ncbi:hypothetical protein VPNG_00287 [Cytospora leucostoma]|uniref:Uncharacterized protein n=1 Tax=Cytospora leucostoma TaxID=1230097 RepID=A0A423XNG2_9PEZI|nr:hypothetical protein VPNG_00287 [Cytospora leucostoma]
MAGALPSIEKMKAEQFAISEAFKEHCMKRLEMPQGTKNAPFKSPSAVDSEFGLNIQLKKRLKLAQTNRKQARRDSEGSDPDHDTPAAKKQKTDFTMLFLEEIAAENKV